MQRNKKKEFVSNAAISFLYSFQAIRVTPSSVRNMMVVMSWLESRALKVLQMHFVSRLKVGL